MQTAMGPLRASILGFICFAQGFYCDVRIRRHFDVHINTLMLGGFSLLHHELYQK